VVQGLSPFGEKGEVETHHSFDGGATAWDFTEHLLEGFDLKSERVCRKKGFCVKIRCRRRVLPSVSKLIHMHRRGKQMKPLSGEDAQGAIRDTIQFFSASLHFAEFDLATIQSLKARRDPLHQVHYITVLDTTGQPWRFTFLLEQTYGVWSAKTMHCGPEEKLDEPPELADCPWIRLTSRQMVRLTQLQKDSEFSAFGEVFDKGYQIVRVRLLDGGEFVVEDTVRDGIVLFTGEQELIFPLQLELYNNSGTLVSRQSQTEKPGSPPSVTKEI
jgi:hypothetical protein